MDHKNTKLALFIMASSIITTFASLYLFNKARGHISKLDNQIEERDSLIRELSFSNQLINEYFDVRLDSINNEKIYTLKESKRTRIETIKVREIEYIGNKFYKNGEALSADSLVSEYNMLNRKWKEEINEITSLYNNLAHEYNDLGKKYMAIEDSLSIKSILLKNIIKRYHIGFNCTRNDSIITTTIYSPKLDSALILLNVYRDKMRYDSKNNQWIIKR